MRSDPTARLLLLSAVAIATLHAGSTPLASNDLHVYMALGRRMCELGGLADTEAFTFTAQGAPFIHGTWGWSLLSWGLHSLGGLDMIRLSKGAAVGLTPLGVALAARAWGASPRASAIAALYAWGLILQNVAARGQTFVYPLFTAALWLAAPEAGRSRLRLGAGSLALGALWAPLHGSFPAGIVALLTLAGGRWWEGRPAKAPALVALGLALGACLGPYGPALWGYVASNGSLPRARGFAEWAPPSLRGFEGARLLAASLLWAALLLRGRRRLGWGELGVIVGFGALALSATRFVAWFGLATALPLALRLSDALPPPEQPWPLARALERAAWPAWAALLLLGLQPPARPLDPDTPVALVQAIAADADGGRLLVAPAFGGYAAFHLTPRFLVSADVLTWVFDDEAWAFTVDLSRAPADWQARLRAEDVTHLLLTPHLHGETLLPAARASEEWVVIAEDPTGAAFKRASAPPTAAP